jgi:PIN domain nuclease of toxin-antitoxin system
LTSAFLLDAQALLWYDVAPDHLSDTVLAVIRGRRNRILVSAMTSLEISIKHRLGKLTEAAALIRDYKASLIRYGFEELPMNSAHALRVAQLESNHPDPFDRVLAAQALELGPPLVTRDPAFDGF